MVRQHLHRGGSGAEHAEAAQRTDGADQRLRRQAREIASSVVVDHHEPTTQNITPDVSVLS